MKIVIFSPTSTTFSLDKDQPLGGADAALLKMITILAKEHEVTAYIPTKHIGYYYNAALFNFERIFEDNVECDLVILYRKMFPIPQNVKYKKAIFYSQDTADTPCFSGLKEKRAALNLFEKVFVLSNFHKENLNIEFDIPEDKFFILGNAADEQLEVEKKKLKFIYCSTPFRGLDVLLKMWQKIIIKYPEAELWLYSSMKIYGAEELDKINFGKMFEDIHNGRFKNVIHVGSVSHERLIKALQDSFMLLYPNVYPETYCNVLEEARASRTPFITTDLGALRELHKGGAFIEGNPRTKEYQQKFLDTLDFVIADERFYKTLQNFCYPIRTWADYEKDLLSEINKLQEIKD